MTDWRVCRLSFAVSLISLAWLGTLLFFSSLLMCCRVLFCLLWDVGCVKKAFSSALHNLSFWYIIIIVTLVRCAIDRSHALYSTVNNACIDLFTYPPLNYIQYSTTTVVLYIYTVYFIKWWALNQSRYDSKHLRTSIIGIMRIFVFSFSSHIQYGTVNQYALYRKKRISINRSINSILIVQYSKL